MKRWLILSFALIITLCGCGKQVASTESIVEVVKQSEINEEDEKYDVSDLCNNISGIWLLLEDDNPYASVSFIDINNDMKMTGGVYPGGGGRTCEITEIQQVETNCFSAVLYYPAVEETEMYEAMPELKEKVIMKSDDMFRSSLTIEYEAGTKQEFEYIAEDFEHAREKIEIIMNNNYDSSNYDEVGKSEYQEENQCMPTVEMCSWCKERPRSSTTFSFYCSSCECAEPGCIKLAVIGSSQYCDLHKK